nr:MAG TPA: hypothetical protein [Bacteriophage sp.]
MSASERLFRTSRVEIILPTSSAKVCFSSAETLELMR